MSKNKVIVAGGGLMGLATAWFLHRRGVSVEIYDRRPAGQEASAAGAGMLPLHSVAFDPPALFELSRYSYGLYPDWIREIQKASGMDPEWMESGSLGLLFNEREETTARNLGGKLEELGLKVEWITGSEARKKEPVISPDVRSALRLPDAVQIRPVRLCRSLIEALRVEGVPIHTHEAIEEILVEGGRVRGVRTCVGRIESERVVVAAGAWSADLLKPLGWDFPVYPLKGQVLLLKGPSGRLKHILFASGYYIVPRRDGELYVGSTLEKVGFDRSVTPAALEALTAAARQMVPGLEPLKVSGMFSGFRPGSVDGHPTLGPLPGVEGLFLAAGHHTHGHLLAPASGHLIAQAVMGEKTDLSLDPFRIGREPHPLQPPWWVKISAS